tara:strand:+ start:41246 stop:41803 length:558 start_codon:yes stop_codon:yes gene_type:complete
MPATTIDPKSALIVVDLQKGVSNAPVLRPMTEIVQNTNRLIDTFRRHGLPTIFVVVEGTAPGRTEQARRAPREFPADFSELIPSLNFETGDPIVKKKTPGAFTHTDLEQRLKDLGVTQVVITGVATSSGVESTARQAYELGFNVTLATDAISDTNEEGEAYSLSRVFPRLGEADSTENLINLINA